MVAGIVALVVFGVLDSINSDFEFSMYQGEDVVQASELKVSEIFPSEKPVVLNFWAGLCPPCRAEMPGFQAVYDQYEDDFTLLGLDIGPFMGLGSHQDARKLLRDLGISYPAGYTHNRDAVTQFRITSMPTTIFFTPEGKVFRREEGFINQAQLANILELLLIDRASARS